MVSLAVLIAPREVLFSSLLNKIFTSIPLFIYLLVLCVCGGGEKIHLERAKIQKIAKNGHGGQVGSGILPLVLPLVTTVDFK